MDPAALAETALVLALGSLVQRLTGMGLALMASPLLVLIMGPVAGVQMLQVVGLGVCFLSAVMLRADCNPRRGLVLLGAALLGLVPGAWVARALSAAPLSILAGSLTLVALAATRWLKTSAVFEGVHGTALAGALSGFMNVTSGVGGPPIVIYAASTDWPYAEYVATVQFYFVGLNLASLLGRGLPDFEPGVWLVVAAASGIGLLIGQIVAGRLDEHLARGAINAVAVMGSAAALWRGITTL